MSTLVKLYAVIRSYPALIDNNNDTKVALDECLSYTLGSLRSTSDD